MIIIFGAEGNIQNVDGFLEKVVSFAKEKDIIIQAFNADLIYGKNHVISAVKHAKRAFGNKTNTTNSLEMEILLYSSGERQLKLAIPKMGVKKGKGNIAFVFVNGESSERGVNELLKKLNLERDDKVLEGDINTLKKFGINKEEISTVSENKFGELVLEKVAMVDILK